MTDDGIALLREVNAKLDRLLMIHELHRASPETRTTTLPTPAEFVLRGPMQVIPLHGPGAPCCDAYGADRVATHDGSAPISPTGLPHCEDEPPGAA